MALPTAGKKATSIFDAPDGDVSGFSFIIDLETLLGSNTDFTGDINTSDSARGRVAWNDDDTEIAFDWMADDPQTDLGLLRGYAGTVLALSSDASRTVDVYTPNTRNTAYSASDTYGSDNAYDSNLKLYWPNGAGTDRTSNGNDSTQTETVTVGGATGQIGDATEFGSDEAGAGTTISIPSSGGLSFGIWCQLDVTPFFDYPLIIGADSSNYMGINTGANNNMFGFGSSAGSSSSYYGDGSAFSHVVVTLSDTSNGSALLYIDGVLEDTVTTTLAVSLFTDFAIANGGVRGIGRGLYMTGNEAQYYHSVLSADSIAYEYSQTSDNSTFWGTWTVSDVSSGYTLTAETGAFTLTGFDASLLYDRIISAETGAFSLTGFDASPLFDRQLTAESGSYILTGQEAGLLYNKAITADAGAYALTGYDADLSLITGYQLIAETGQFNVTGFDASLLLNRVIETGAGSFVLTGYDATLNVLTGYTLDAEPGSYTLTGEDVNLLRDAVIQAEAGSYNVIGYPATLTYSGAVTLDPPDIIQTGGAIDRYKTIAGTITINLTIKGELV